MFIISTFNGRYGIYRNDHPNFYFNTMNISSSAALQANTTLLNSAQKQLLLANKYYDQGEYDRSFHLFCRSVENSNRLLDTVSGFNSGCYDRKARYRIFTSDRMKDYQIEDRFKALKELFTAIDQRDEQLDLLHDFLVDSGMELYHHLSVSKPCFIDKCYLASLPAWIISEPIFPKPPPPITDWKRS